MILSKPYRLFLLALTCAIVFAAAPSVLCQEQSSSSRAALRDDDTNLETQLYLILATNREIDEGKIPAALDPIIKRLRESLPFKHYSVAGTFLIGSRTTDDWMLVGSEARFCFRRHRRQRLSAIRVLISSPLSSDSQPMAAVMTLCA